MNKISCFLPYAGKEQVEKTVNSLQATGLIEEIRLITTDATLESLPDCEILFVDMPYSSATLKAIANAAKGEYTLLYTKETTLEMGMFALERMIHILEDSSAGMGICRPLPNSRRQAEQRSGNRLPIRFLEG